MVDACVVCGSEESLCAFSLDEGGVTCRDHRRGSPLVPEALLLLQLVLSGRVAAALARPLSPATYEVEHLATRSMEHHLERRLRSLAILDRG